MNTAVITPHDRQISAWLLVCCMMIFFMVVLGGVTRLTGSGLSMVQWDPIFGIVPPLSADEWNRTFDLYKKSPEYRKINFDMDLQGFKKIYWFEFSHRVLGRMIGTVFLLPFLYFLYKRMVRRSLKPKLAALFILGGLQGLLGWYMVKSGLVDNPHVSQYRLASHLGLAVFIYAWMLHIALSLRYGRSARGTAPPLLKLATGLILTLVFVTILSGGFVAGLKAGHAYNTFPLMDGRWVPQVIFMLEPMWLNFFENIATVQFNHRLLALLVFSLTTLLWFASLRHALPRPLRIGLHLMMAAAVLQVLLGISTLLLHVPISLAATHQAGALLLLTAVLFVNQRMN